MSGVGKPGPRSGRGDSHIRETVVGRGALRQMGKRLVVQVWVRGYNADCHKMKGD